MKGRFGSWAAFAVTFAARPLYLRQLPTFRPCTGRQPWARFGLLHLLFDPAEIFAIVRPAGPLPVNQSKVEHQLPLTFLCIRLRVSRGWSVPGPRQPVAILQRCELIKESKALVIWMKRLCRGMNPVRGKGWIGAACGRCLDGFADPQHLKAR
jgi:hypothetical protein